MGEELTAGFEMIAKDGTMSEARTKEFLDLIGSKLSGDDIHDMFMVGGGKNGFTLEGWLGAFEHKDHGDQDGEVEVAWNCVQVAMFLIWPRPQKLWNSLDWRSIPKKWMRSRISQTITLIKR